MSHFHLLAFSQYLYFVRLATPTAAPQLCLLLFPLTCRISIFCPLPSLFSFSPFLFLHFFCCVLRKCCEKLFDKQFSARFSLSPLPRCHWPAWACQSARKSRYSVAIFSVLAWPGLGWAGLGCCWRHKNANFLIGFLSDHMRWQGVGGDRGGGSWNDCSQLGLAQLTSNSSLWRRAGRRQGGSTGGAKLR